MDIGEPFGIGRPVAQRGAKMFDRRLRFIQRRQRATHIVVRRRMIGLNRQHLPEIPDRLVVPSQIGEHVAQVVERRAVPRPQRQRPPQMRLGHLVLLQSQQRGAQVVVNPRIVRARGCRPAQMAGRVREAPLVEAHDAQQMQRVDLPRVVRDQLAASAFGLGIIARPIEAHCRRHARGRPSRDPIAGRVR
jgi:hypothetical protein